MDKVRTGNTRLMRQGDECVFINNVDMLPEYHITTHKEYSGIILSVRVDNHVNCEIMNDAGETATHGVGYGSFAGGYSNANSVLSREEYINRVNILHAQNITKLNEQMAVELNALNALRDKMLEVANVTASI